MSNIKIYAIFFGFQFLELLAFFSLNSKPLKNPGSYNDFDIFLLNVNIKQSKYLLTVPAL